MLNMTERQSIADQLARLRDRLKERPETMIHELPADLQQAIRAEKSIGALTSSGLERLPAIIDRIEWARHYLLDPNFLQNQEILQTEATRQVAEVRPDKSITKIENEHSIPVPTNDQPIDFGPFNPERNGS